MRILVGADGSEHSRVAMQWAASFAQATDAELVVAFAWHPRFAEVSNDEFETLRGEAAARLDQWSAPLRDGPVTARPRLLHGDARDVLIDAADDEDVALVVVGAPGMGDHLHALHLGSVTHHLVHHSPRPVAAIPTATRPAWPAPIVIGVEDSEGSRRVVDWCAGVAGAFATEIVAVHSEEMIAEWLPHADPRSWYQATREHVEQWIAPARRSGVAPRIVIQRGDPVDAITKAATHEHAGLVVVGGRGRGGVLGLRLGSTALKVLHHSHLPVVMVPAPDA